MREVHKHIFAKHKHAHAEREREREREREGERERGRTHGRRAHCKLPRAGKAATSDFSRRHAGASGFGVLARWIRSSSSADSSADATPVPGPLNSASICVAFARSCNSSTMASSQSDTTCSHAVVCLWCRLFAGWQQEHEREREDGSPARRATGWRPGRGCEPCLPRGSGDRAMRGTLLAAGISPFSAGRRRWKWAFWTFSRT